MAPTRSAPVKVVVCQCPCGTAARQRWPCKARPRSRAILVDAPVSSMNTRRSGSRSGCALNQALRRAATSGRSCSAACAVFFEGHPVPVQAAPDRAGHERGAMILLQHGGQLGQRDILLRFNRSQDHAGKRLDLVLGEFNWSSQHSGQGGWDGGSASVRSCVAEQAAFAGTTSGRAAGAPAAFLGIDRGGAVERGRGDWRGRVDAGRSTVVSEGRRHATIDACAIIEAVVWAIPVVCRAGGACDPACPGRRGAADRPADGAVGIDDLARAAAQRCHARRRVGLSGHYGAVAC